MAPIQKLVAESPFLIRDSINEDLGNDEFNTDLKIDIISPKPFNVNFDEDFKKNGSRNRKSGTETFTRSKSVF